MSVLTTAELTRKKCAPCEGGVPKLTPDETSWQGEAQLLAAAVRTLTATDLHLMVQLAERMSGASEGEGGGDEGVDGEGRKRARRK